MQTSAGPWVFVPSRRRHARSLQRHVSAATVWTMRVEVLAEAVEKAAEWLKISS